MWCACLSGQASPSFYAQEGSRADTIVLQETTVTANRISETLTEANPHFRIDEKQLLSNGVTDISDALHRLPGVTLRDYGGAGGLKTVSIRGLGASHTAVIYDGLPLTDIQKGAIDLSRYSIDNISQLDLVIGDNNDIFIPVKSAACPASISISSFNPISESGGSVIALLKAGSFGYISPNVKYSQNFGKNFILGVTGSFIHAKNNYPFKLRNGDIITNERRENNRMNSLQTEVNVSWRLSRETILNGKIYYYDNDRQLPGPVIYYNVSNNNENLKDRNFFAQADYIKQFADKWKIRFAAKFNRDETRYIDFSVSRNEENLKENYYQREYYVTGNLMLTFSKRWSFDYSADYSHNNLNSNLKSDVRPRRNSILQSLTAKYISRRLTVIGRLIESLYFESAKSPQVAHKTYSRLSPSISANYKLLRKGLLYGRVSYKNIFRMPSFNEAYFHHFGSPDLKPETTNQIDVGLTYQLPSFPVLSLLSLTVDFYKNRVKDRIVAVPYNMFLWTITNLNSVKSTGLDMTVNSTLNIGKGQQVVLSGTWSYMRAKIDVEKSEIIYGKQVAYTPKNSGSFSVGYENPWVNLVIHGQGTSARYTQNSNIPQTRLSGYFETGVTLSKSMDYRKMKFEVRLDILNLLDKQYFVVARYPMPGRSFMAAIKFMI